MNYIGSKHKLSAFIVETVKAVVGADLTNKVFCDLFAGTGIVGRNFKPLVKKVIANDSEFYSFVLNQNYIGNHREIAEKSAFLAELEALTSADDGFIYQNYCAGSGSGRQYFSDDNGKKIDAARRQIETWKTANRIDDSLYYFLLASLLEAADKVANTASVYGAFLKKLKPTAQKPLTLAPAQFLLNDNDHEVFNADANNLITQIRGDILYLDPPYNQRQYGANYHLLNTIARYQPFTPQGKTGLPPDYARSNYCRKNRVAIEFERLIKRADFPFVFVSYNNEGLMTVAEIKTLMEKYGKYRVVSTAYQRFKADNGRAYSAAATEEYLHILEK
ncbi:restriction endonuclease subunit M [Planctomycetales bacterium]|nr:restriction endonuclease subunit M [Planctomycetales bacterium]GHT04626.1 restriction endonuclease subunit M [Planctomycetales bacterium]